MKDFEETGHEIDSPDRREVMSAIVKYSAVIGGASTTVLTASEAIAKSAASGRGYKKKKKCNNGLGNGVQCAPGKSRPKKKKKAKNAGALHGAKP